MPTFASLLIMAVYHILQFPDNPILRIRIIFLRKRMNFKLLANYTLAFTFMAAMLSACSSHKSSLVYFEDVDQLTQAVGSPEGYSIKIQPDDELMITVNSFIPSASAPYNLPVANIGTNASLGTKDQPMAQTYIVDNNGDVAMPILGKVHVEGLTCEQIAEKVTELVSRDVEDPSVMVRLLNFKVNVAGEVKTPGPQTVRTERYSILDALTAAGDLTEFGERSNVLVIRDENGKRTAHRLNLNSADVLSSPYFYLRQNDYVYVEPNKIREDNSKYNQNNAFKLSVVSAVVSGVSVIASLVIALAVK